MTNLKMVNSRKKSLVRSAVKQGMRQKQDDKTKTAEIRRKAGLSVKSSVHKEKS